MNVRGRIKKEIYRNDSNNYFVAIFMPNIDFLDEFPDEIRIVGKYRNNFYTDIEYDVMCELKHNERYGTQYDVKSISPHVEPDEKSIMNYLTSSLFKGIGASTVHKIIDMFGEKSLDVITYEPDRLKDELKLTPRQVSILYKGVTSDSIINKLKRLVPNISDALIDKIIDAYSFDDGETGSSKILDIIMNEPYRLLYDVKNIKFRDVDQIALATGIDKYDITRMTECYKFCLYQYVNSTGNLFMQVYNSDYSSFSSDYSSFYDDVKTEIGYNDKTYADMIITANKVSDLFFNIKNYCKSIIVSDNNSKGQQIYNIEVYEEEHRVATIIAESLLKPSSFMRRMLEKGYTKEYASESIEIGIRSYERKMHISLDDSQKNAVRICLMFDVSVINGGPGHGKTSTINCILHVWSKFIDDVEPILAAPTGRAVSVMKKATYNKYDVSTLMRLIYQYDLINDETKRKELEKKYTNTIVIVDECSMIGIKTISQFLPMFKDCQFIFVGDVDQLPSIEYGQFFNDLCSCNSIMKQELLQNHRAAADGRIIIENAKQINKMNPQQIDYTDVDHFSIKECYGDFSTEIVNEYANLVYDQNGDLNIPAMSDVIVICPTNKQETGALYINKLIQDLVNPHDPLAEPKDRGYIIPETHMYINENNKDVKLRVGDRVMQTKNRQNAKCVIISGVKRQDSLGIYNGDTGIILSYHPSLSDDTPSTLKVLFDDGRVTTVEEENMKELTLAYATTVHKAQGSEYNNVIFSSQYVLTQPIDFSCKNILYTAVTRAKKSVKIIGYKNGIDNCVTRSKKPRNSMLHERIMDEVKRLRQTQNKN